MQLAFCELVHNFCSIMSNGSHPDQYCHPKITLEPLLRNLRYRSQKNKDLIFRNKSPITDFCSLPLRLI